MKPIYGETREEAWFNALTHLNGLNGRPEYNLLMEVKAPNKSNEISKKISALFDELLKSANLYPLHTVAETIFPATEYKKYGKSGVMNVYPDEIYPKIRCGDGNSKGTYAYRMVRGIDAKGAQCNPLENTIKRLDTQVKCKGIRCAFELSLDQVETIPINRNDSQVRGFPCLSHLSFKLNEDRSLLHLTALYRSHDYIQKALGNLLGLARLQAFVAREINVGIGVLVCHSTIARLDYHPKIGKKVINDFAKILEGN